jgi:CBS domain-containing protein
MTSTSVAAQRAVRHIPLKAKDVMQRPVIAVTPRASLRDIAWQILKYGFSGMPVAEADGKVLGVITEADLKRVMQILQERRIVRVPVTEKGKLVGIISRRDVIRAVVEPEFIAFGDVSTSTVAGGLLIKFAADVASS